MKLLAGDYEGPAYIQFGALWTGPQASKFKGIKFDNPRKSYAAADLARVKVLDSETSKTFLRTAVAGAIGGVLLGPAGLLAGAFVGGKKVTERYGIEFTDGKRVIVSGDANDKSFKCLLLFAEETHRLEAPAQVEF